VGYAGPLGGHDSARLRSDVFLRSFSSELKLAEFALANPLVAKPRRGTAFLRKAEFFLDVIGEIVR